MLARRYQTEMDLGPEDHLWTLWGKANGRPAIRIVDPTGQETYRTLPKFFAVQQAADAVALGCEAHASQNTFHSRRLLSDVAEFNNAVVDLDTNKYGDGDTFLATIREKTGLPAPTLFGSSGRGSHLYYCFREPLTADKGFQYQYLQDRLIDVLRPFGSDPAARDATHLFRVSGSPNFKPGAGDAHLRRTGSRVSFHFLMKFLKSTEPARQLERQKAVWTVAGPYPAYRLAWLRRLDLVRIAERRAPVMDGRKRLLFVYSAVGAWFHGTPEANQEETQAFALTYCQDGALYAELVPKIAKTVLDRMRAELAGESWQGGRNERFRRGAPGSRYTPSNRYLARVLDLSDEEQMDTRQIMDAGERARRKAERDRRRWKKRRDEYEAECEAHTAAQREQALVLRAAGCSIREGATRMGIAKSRFHRLLTEGVPGSASPNKNTKYSPGG
jgi:hypothetical protein